MKEIIDVTSKYKDLYNTALEDVVRLSKENTKLKSENIRLKDVNANLKNVNANLNLEKGRLQGNLDYKNQRLKEYEKQLDLDYVDNNYISKSKLETEKRKCIYTEIEDNVWQCSNCKTKWLKEEESPKDFNYCPKCGYRIEFKEGN